MGQALRVAIDLDGVLYPFVDAFRCWLLRPELPEPDLFDLDVAWDLDGKFPELLTEFGESGGYKLIEPYAGVLDLLADMDAHGVDLFAVTSRPKTKRVIADTLGWLSMHEVPVLGVELRCVKAAVEADILIDDELAVYRQADDVGDVVPLLVARSYNEAQGVRRAPWKVLADVVKLTAAGVYEEDLDEFDRRAFVEEMLDELLEPESFLETSQK